MWIRSLKLTNVKGYEDTGNIQFSKSINMGATGSRHPNEGVTSVPPPRKTKLKKRKGGTLELGATAPGSLREIEREGLVAGREWIRGRLEEKLQAEADRRSGVFPLSGRKARQRRKVVMPRRGGSGG